MSRSQQNADYLAQQAYIASVLAPILRGYIQGAQLSTAGSSSTMTVAAGMVANSTSVNYISLTSPIAKTTSAWAVGTAAGGLDTGSITTSTWYYFYLIYNPTSLITDVVFSTSSSAPSLPSGYTTYRYIGAGLTNGSSQWTSFIQTGREFWWASPVLDFNATPSTTAASLTLSVPRGRKMKAFLNALGGQGGTVMYLSDLSTTDLAPSTTAAPLGNTTGYATNVGTTTAGSVWTNTSAQIRNRSSTAGANALIVTLGWIDLADSQ